MRRLNAHLTSSTRAALLFTAVLAGADCTGTPLPEPPDELPRPEFGALRELAAPVSIDQNPPLSADVVLESINGGAPPGAQVWAVNLDTASPVPVEVKANDLGGYRLVVTASVDNRIRIVARTERQHSAPLDLIVAKIFPAMPVVATVEKLRDTRLGCLSLTPAETVVLSGKRGELVLNNQCAAEVTLEKAGLLFGTEGIALEMPASTLMPGKQTKLTFTDSRGPSQSERLDILLLEVSTPDLTGRYAIDVFSDLK